MGAFSEDRHRVNIKGHRPGGGLLQPFIVILGQEAGTVHPRPTVRSSSASGAAPAPQGFPICPAPHQDGSKELRSERDPDLEYTHSSSYPCFINQKINYLEKSLLHQKPE